MAAWTVQRHDQFRAVEHCMLKILVERDGIVRAGDVYKRQNKHCHVVIYSPEKNEVVALFLDTTDSVPVSYTHL